MLCPRIEGSGRNSVSTGETRDRDKAAMCLLEIRKCVPRAVNTAEVVDCSDSLNRFDVVQLVKPGMHADASVVYESVDTTKLGRRFLDQLATLIAVGDIRGNCQHSRAECAAALGSFAEKRGVSRCENERGS